MPTSVALSLLGFLGIFSAYRLSRSRKKQCEIAAAKQPPAIYSTLTTETKDPTLDEKTLHVLKWFSSFRNGSAPVSAVDAITDKGFDYVRIHAT